MAETDRSSESDARPPGAEPSDSATSELAEALECARFVRIVARADGDALAAAGLVGRALSRRSIPFQARVTRLDPSREYGSAADETSLLIGATDADDALAVPSGPTSAASVLAFDAVDAIGADPDPTLALAGVVAAKRAPDEYERFVEAAPVERRPGVGIPTADLADGLAHTTLAHAPFSGDEMAAGAALADLADDDDKSIASTLALATIQGAPPRAAEAVSRALNPHAISEGEGTFATVEGYADVLDCAARERPGTALALALGHDVRVEALEAWRSHASAAHDAVRSATTGRYDGLFVARVDDAPVETAVRLLREFRSPEPVALVVSDGEAAATGGAGTDLGEAVRAAASAVGGAGAGTAREGYARFDGDAREFMEAFREALDR